MEGALFADIDEYDTHNKLKPNIVDMLDLPKGFKYKDLNSEKGLFTYTIPFEFPPEHDLKPHKNLRILTPIGCLKSRLSNHNLKPLSVEKERILALIEPIVFYIQDQLNELGFRKTKNQIDALIHIIESNESINMSVMHGIDLIDILDFFAKEKIDGMPDNFIKKELPRVIKRISHKI